jgi:hypothetical protein
VRLAEVRAAAGGVVAAPVERPERYLRDVQPRAIGLGLEIAGPLAFPRFAGEAGRHLVQDGNVQHEVGVIAPDTRLALYVPPPGIGRKGALAALLEGAPRRRTYDPARRVAEDGIEKRPIRFPTGRLEEAVSLALEERFRATLEHLVDS